MKIDFNLNVKEKKINKINGSSQSHSISRELNRYKLVFSIWKFQLKMNPSTIGMHVFISNSFVVSIDVIRWQGSDMSISINIIYSECWINHFMFTRVLKNTKKRKCDCKMRVNNECEKKIEKWFCSQWKAQMEYYHQDISALTHTNPNTRTQTPRTVLCVARAL